MRPWVTTLVVWVVAIVAAVLSGAHIIDLGLGALPPEHAWQAYLLPLPIDGCLLLASMSLADARRQDRSPGFIVWLTLFTGVIGSIAANFSAAPPTLTGRLLAISAPIALALSIEILLSRSGRAIPAVSERRRGNEIPSEGKDTGHVISEPLSAVPNTAEAEAIPASSVKPLEASSRPKSKGSKLPADTQEANRIIAETYRDQGITPNRAQVRRDHRVGAPRADQIIRLIRDMTSEHEPKARELVPVGA